MVLVRQTEPLRAEDDPSEPLKNGDDKVTPNLSANYCPAPKSFGILHRSCGPARDRCGHTQPPVLRDGQLLGGAPMEPNKLTSRVSSYLTKFMIDPPTDGVYEVKPF